MEIIFKLLCGVLYAIGWTFGLSYTEISIYICIYMCPIVCILSAFIAMCFTIKSRNIIGRIMFSINSALLIMYVNICDVFWKHYSVSDPFTLCMNDIMEMAKRMHITYAEANIKIYCTLFFGILTFHLSTILVNKLFKRKNYKLVNYKVT